MRYTALERLAGIELSRGKPAAALACLQVIQGSSGSDSVTNLLLSDALAAEGEAAKAAAIVSSTPWATGRLLFQGWYRYRLEQAFSLGNLK